MYKPRLALCSKGEQKYQGKVDDSLKSKLKLKVTIIYIGFFFKTRGTVKCVLNLVYTNFSHSYRYEDICERVVICPPQGARKAARGG